IGCLRRSRLRHSGPSRSGRRMLPVSTRRPRCEYHGVVEDKQGRVRALGRSVALRLSISPWRLLDQRNPRATAYSSKSVLAQTVARRAARSSWLDEAILGGPLASGTCSSTSTPGSTGRSRLDATSLAITPGNRRHV